MVQQARHLARNEPQRRRRPVAKVQPLFSVLGLQTRRYALDAGHAHWTYGDQGCLGVGPAAGRPCLHVPARRPERQQAPRRVHTGSRQQTAGSRQQSTGNRQQATGNRGEWVGAHEPCARVCGMCECTGVQCVVRGVCAGGGAYCTAEKRLSSVAGCSPGFHSATSDEYRSTLNILHGQHGQHAVSTRLAHCRQAASILRTASHTVSKSSAHRRHAVSTPPPYAWCARAWLQVGGRLCSPPLELGELVGNRDVELARHVAAKRAQQRHTVVTYYPSPPCGKAYTGGKAGVPPPIGVPDIWPFSCEVDSPI